MLCQTTRNRELGNCNALLTCCCRRCYYCISSSCCGCYCSICQWIYRMILYNIMIRLCNLSYAYYIWVNTKKVVLEFARTCTDNDNLLTLLGDYIFAIPHSLNFQKASSPSVIGRIPAY